MLASLSRRSCAFKLLPFSLSARCLAPQKECHLIPLSCRCGCPVWPRLARLWRATSEGGALLHGLASDLEPTPRLLGMLGPLASLPLPR